MTDAGFDPLANLRAFAEPVARGQIRQQPENFQVDEILGFEPDGEGEHLWLLLCKRNWNTEDLAVWLARSAGLPRRAVSFSGLKDRQAVTRQWFSLHLPGKSDPVFDWPEGVYCEQQQRHRRKLNRGTHRANGFRLRITDFQGDADAVENRLQQIRQRGVPNYFAEQRFGRGGNNWYRGVDWLKGQGEAPRKKALRSLWLSAVRSGLFNQVLAERVRENCWDQLLNGDILQPVGSRGLFSAQDEPRAAERINIGEVNPTAPLPGVPGMASSAACAQLEQQILLPWTDVIDALIELGVEESRRPTRLLMDQLQWQQETDGLLLAFNLPPGAYATSVLAELMTWEA